MPDANNSTTRTSRSALANYDILYADAIGLLCTTLADDERNTRCFMNADGPATANILTGVARRITPLKERYLQLKRTSNNLLLLAQAWMHDAAKHTQTQHEEEQQKYKKLRDDRGVSALEGRALERLKVLRNAINNAVEEYNDQTTSQRKWPENPRPRLSFRSSLSKLEAASRERLNADQCDQSSSVSDANLQDALTDGDVFRGATEAAPDQSDQSRVGAEVSLHDPFTEGDEVRGSTEGSLPATGQPDDVADVNLQRSFTESDDVSGSSDAAPDQPLKPDQSNAVADADVKLQGPSNDEVRVSSDEPPGQSDQPNVVTDVTFQDSSTMQVEVRSSTDATRDQFGQSPLVADEDFQDFLIESDEVRGLTNAASVQFSQSNDDAKVPLQDPIGNGEARSATGLPKDQPDQPDAVADVTLQDSFTEIKEVKGSTDAARDQSDQPDTMVNTSFQDPFAENSESVRDSAGGDGSSLTGVCDAEEYADSVQTLTAMLQELDKHHDSFNNEFVQSDDRVREQVIRVLRGASNRVSTIAKKWMKKAATDAVRQPTESQMLQTMRKDLHVLSLQRRVSTRLQKLRSARRGADQTSTDQRSDQNDDQYGVRADGATHTHGLEATVDSGGYIERFPKPTKPDDLLAKLKHLQSLPTPTKPTSPQPEGFQAQPEIANIEGFKTSVKRERGPDSKITRSPAQTSYVTIRPTRATQTSTTIKAECQPINQTTLCCRGGGFLRHRLQEVSDSRSCTLTSFSKATVVKRLEDPSPDAERDEHASHHPDEFEITYQDLNEPFSDSEDTDPLSDGCENKDETVYQDLNEPSSDSDDLKTSYQDLNEPSFDSDDPDQTNDGSGDEIETEYQGHIEPPSCSEDQDQTGMKDSEQGSDIADQCDKALSGQSDEADQIEDPLPDQAIDEADQHGSDQYEESAYASDQFEQPAYESDQYEQSVSEKTDDDADVFDEPSADQGNDQTDQSSDQDNDQANQFDEPFSDSDASEKSNDGADEDDEPVSDAEGPDEDISDADE